ncbi:MAG: RHS repeat-associated core domain-containing protein [Candidatus Kapaibacterium sp.]
MIWLDDWYVYGSEADGRIATVDPKEIIAVNGSRMTGSEFPHPLNEYNASSPPDSLLPTAMRDTNIFGMNASYRVQQRIPDFRRYEIKDHLGNVRTVIADYKNPELTAPPISAWKYLADVKNISNMYPYGKSYGTNAIYNAAEDYRYGFNGKEKEKNMDASGDITDFGARVYDSELPMFLSPDPKEGMFANKSTYSISANNPILNIDVNGEWPWVANNWLGKYMPQIELYQGQYETEKSPNINRIQISKAVEEKFQNRLSRFYHKWNNPNSKSYSPKIAKFLKEERINIAVAELQSTMSIASFSGGKTINNDFMYLNTELLTETGGMRSSETEETFMHELVHVMGLGEFQAFSVVYSAGLMDEKDIEKYFNTEESLRYLLKGSGADIYDYFYLYDNSTTIYTPDGKYDLEIFKFKEVKREEFFN